VSDQRLCDSEISVDAIRLRLQEYAGPAVSFPAGRNYRAAAVLVPLVCTQEKWHLLFTRRTDLVQNHKGQVSFPGGAAEMGDTCREDTALRETGEEIGIARDQIEILGKMWEMPTITGFSVTPVVGQVQWPAALHISPNEVSRVFTAPLDWLADPANHEEVDLTLPDGRREKVIYFQLFDGEKIWGATARIVINFLRVIGLI
jgi:8-oxo-dGTP pyrophosphatase MutT (NUDIX family)